MSVQARLRSESKIEFLYTARLLTVSVIKSCVDSKKGRYVETVSKPVTEKAWEIYGHVKVGNSIYPTNQHEVQLRRDQFIMAKAKLHALASDIGIAHEFYHFSDHDLDEMCGYIDKELTLIDGVLESDRKRYRNLPGYSTDEEVVPMALAKGQFNYTRKTAELLKELTDFILGRNQPPKNLVP